MFIDNLAVGIRKAGFVQDIDGVLMVLGGRLYF
jgi:hypothetical protein